jgi:hypothetical protein
MREERQHELMSKRLADHALTRMHSCALPSVHYCSQLYTCVCTQHRAVSAHTRDLSLPPFCHHHSAAKCIESASSTAVRVQRSTKSRGRSRAAAAGSRGGVPEITAAASITGNVQPRHIAAHISLARATARSMQMEAAPERVWSAASLELASVCPSPAPEHTKTPLACATPARLTKKVGGATIAEQPVCLSAGERLTHEKLRLEAQQRQQQVRACRRVHSLPVHYLHVIALLSVAECTWCELVAETRWA